MGRHGFLTVAPSFPYDQASCQCSDSGTDVNDKPSGKVEGPKISNPATCPPDPVGERVIDKGRPENKEDKIGLELKSLGKSPRDQGRGDDSEHHLKNHEGLMGNRSRIIGE